MWKLDWTEEFEAWVRSDAVDEAAREDIWACARVLEQEGPRLGRPLVDTVKKSRHSNMKELRVQSCGRPFRVFFAFDRCRRPVFLIGGNKQGNQRFYEQYVPRADELFDRHLARQ